MQKIITPWIAIGAGLWLWLGMADAAAQSDPVARGRDIAAARCSRCHGVGVSDESPHPIVLPLRQLHERQPVEMLDEALRTGVIGGHDEMPMFELGREDAAALVSYIESLAAEKWLPRAPAWR